MERELRFAVDRMLGKLAKKLRILGHDTVYFKDEDENTILRRSVGRILLTRDKVLYRKARKLGIETLYLKSDLWRSQLRAVADVYPVVELAKPFTRCPVCNSELVDVERQEVRGKVPEYVYKTFEVFKKCPVCEKIYWRGTHVDSMIEDFRKTVGL